MECFETTLIELVYKNKIKPSQRTEITGSKAAYKMLSRIWDKDKIELQEECKVMLLNRAHKLLGIYEVATGTVTGVMVDPKLIFAAALLANACAIVIAHNHPSGDVTPSPKDELMVQKLKYAGQLLDIVVADFIIIMENEYYSFAGHNRI